MQEKRAEDLKLRTKRFAIDVVKYYQAMPESGFKYTVGKQFIRSGTSVGANYRSACRGRSKAEFLAKLGICEEECDEVMFWLELIIESNDINPKETKRLYLEAEELLKIFVSSINTGKKGN